MFYLTYFTSCVSRDVTNRAIIRVNSIVSGWNFDILSSIVDQLLTSRLSPNVCRMNHTKARSNPGSKTKSGVIIYRFRI